MKYLWLLMLLFPCLPGRCGVLVTRTAKGIEFSESAAVLVNGKDKALAIGIEPKLTKPVNKLTQSGLSGILLMDVSTGAIVSYEGGRKLYLIPDGVAKTASGEASPLWKGARLSSKKTANDKARSEVEVSTFLAFVPNGPESLVSLAIDNQAMTLFGGRSGPLGVQIEMIGAVARKYRDSPAVGPLQSFVERRMRQSSQLFESGAAMLDVLEEGLKFAELSQAIYEKVPEHEMLRKSLRDRKASLERQKAVLQAFDAGEEWDAFLVGYRNFEIFGKAFPDLKARHLAILGKSVEQHVEDGDSRLRRSEYGAAHREFRKALQLQPSDAVLQQKLSIAWNEHSNQVATERFITRPTPRQSERDAVTQALDFASRYLSSNKLEDAMKSVQVAEGVIPAYLPVLLKKAAVQTALGRYTEALRTLEEYDLHAVKDERAEANLLRNDVLFKRKNFVAALKAEAALALSERRPDKLLMVAQGGLIAANDPELYYYAGLAALMTRKAEIGRNYLGKYLEMSNTLGADQTRRATALSLQRMEVNSPAAETGEPNWLSGKRLPKGIFYCPISLAFQPKPALIDASNKLKVTFEWAGERLRTITPVFEKAGRESGERKITFAYDEAVPQVGWVSDSAAEKIQLPTNADAVLKSNSVPLYSNNAYVDPAVVEKITRKNVSFGIAGNRFFHPFAWDSLHYFKFKHDAQGRIVEAREFDQAPSAGPPVWLEFEWNGSRLAAVRGYQGDPARRFQIYERVLEYKGERLLGERILWQGKKAYIQYNYSGNRLVSADCDNDLSLDGRSRKVTFLANSPSTLVN